MKAKQNVLNKTGFGDLGLHQWLIKACNEMGFQHPTAVQEACIPQILSGKDCIGTAETGSGKTAAFALPILHHLSTDPCGFYALILTPARELAIQISEQVKALGAPMGLRQETCIGGVDLVKQSLRLQKKPHVIVATPGRLLDQLMSKTISFPRLKFLVFDEADRLLNNHAEEVEKILEYLPAERQNLLFSATLSENISKMFESHSNKPFCFRQQTSALHTVVKTLSQYFMFMPEDVKICYLVYLLRENPDISIIVFTSSSKITAMISLALKRLDISAVALHSQLKQKDRFRSLNQFKSRYTQVLVATDVASRGLDIPEVELVINYDIPNVVVDYIHRIGRTARAGKTGRAISFVTQYDIDLISAIESEIGFQLEEFVAEESEILKHLSESTSALKIAEVKLAEDPNFVPKQNRKRKYDDVNNNNNNNNSNQEKDKKFKNHEGNDGHSEEKKKSKVDKNNNNNNNSQFTIQLFSNAPKNKKK